MNEKEGVWSPHDDVLDISKKKIIFIDMDDTIVDFYNAAKNENKKVEEARMYDRGFFLNLQPVEGALYAVRKLQRLGFDVWILSQPLYDSFWSYEEKARWISQWFPDLSQKLILAQHKGFFKGDYLIDDNAKKWKEPFEKNGGKFVHFPYRKEDNNHVLNRAAWQDVVDFFKNENPLEEK